jgi:hypothetical protein
VSGGLKLEGKTKITKKQKSTGFLFKNKGERNQKQQPRNSFNWYFQITLYGDCKNASNEIIFNFKASKRKKICLTSKSQLTSFSRL